MPVSRTWSIVLLQFFCHFKADALPFSITLQHKPQLFAYHSGTWKTSLPLVLKKERGTVAKVFHICCWDSHLFLVLISRHSQNVCQQIGIVILPCSNNLKKFHLMIAILEEEDSW